jgi:hypothetical protein
MHFPSVSGIGPVKIRDLAKNRGENVHDTVQYSTVPALRATIHNTAVPVQYSRQQTAVSVQYCTRIIGVYKHWAVVIG